MKIIIAGAGIAGLSAALALHRHGFANIRIYERAATFADIGAGIQLGANAMRVIAHLGLKDAVMARASQPAAMQICDLHHGRMIAEMQLGMIAERRWGAPYLQIHRADLIEILAEKLNQKMPDALQMGAEITEITEIVQVSTDQAADGQIKDGQRADGISVRLADGNAAQAALLIGADGLYSQARAHLSPQFQPHFTGQLAWRMMVPIYGARLPAISRLWFGRGGHAIAYPLRSGKWLNLVAVVERDQTTAQGWDIRGSAEQALADMQGWHSQLLFWVRAASEHHLWALYDHKPLARWSKGAMVVIGDAAHPMLPFLAQGAAMALEDSWVLARTLSNQQSHISDALLQFEQLRKTRTSRVQATARANASHYHQRAPLLRGASHGLLKLAGAVRSDLLHRQWDWLYGHRL